MIEIKLPDIGEGIAEGEIVSWAVQIGDQIEIDAPLVEVLTDKASVEIPSPIKGQVSEILFEVGDLVPVGEVIVRLKADQSKSSISHSSELTQPTQRFEASVSATPESPSATASEVLATPSIRRHAREKEIDLSQIKGTGPYGRILLADLEAVEQPVVASAVQNASDPVQASAMPAYSSASSVSSVSSAPASANEERIPLRGIRRKIAEQMVKAKFTAPDFLYADEADLSELVKFRQAVAGDLKAEGIKLTYLPFIIKAVVSGLKKFPTLNASLDDEAQEIVLKKDYHIGFATASPHGLFVPVIKNADQKSLLELSQEIVYLAERVREGKASSEEMRGGTFTITNIGAIGGIMSSPIINHPEVAIMGVNKIYQKPMVYQNEIAIRWACTFSLSFDHRVVDGADGARFTNHVIHLLENPQRLLLEI